MHNSNFQASLAVLFALLAGVFMGACKKSSPQENQRFIQAEVQKFQAQIKKVIKDPDRAAQAEALVAQVPAMCGEAEKRQIELDQSFHALFANYESSKQEYETLLAKNREERLASHQSILKLTADFGQITTDEEWNKLRKSRTALFKAYAANLRHRI